MGAKVKNFLVLKKPDQSYDGLVYTEATCTTSGQIGPEVLQLNQP